MAEEGRARSRSRGREAAESETPDMPEGAPGVPEEALGMTEGNTGMTEGAPDMSEGAPGVPERVPDEMTAVPPPASSGMEILELAQKLSECTTKIGKVIEDLGLTFDEFNNGRLELQKGFQELSTQIKSTNHCITTMTAGVAFQAGEVTKLLKAFDRWANTGRWALAGTQSVETNIQGVQGEVEKQAQKLETNLKEGFESIGGYLQEVVRLLGERPVTMGESGAPLTPGMQ